MKRALRHLEAVRDAWPRGGPAAAGLPPGQGLARRFFRFGVHFADPPPAVPAGAQIEVRGATAAPFDLPVAALRELPRRTLLADFHCVAGWSVRDLTWEGVPFRTLWEQTILPDAAPQGEITHLALVGLDGYRATLTLEDALADDVLLADRLDGAPLSPEHGAPVRFVTPGQYGYKNLKHLCRIELHTGPPGGSWHASGLRSLGLAFVAPHPRARVAHEERHAHLPAWAVTFAYRRALLPVLVALTGPGRSSATPPRPIPGSGVHEP